MIPKLHFFAKKFGHVKKKQYLCTRFPELGCSGTPKISNFWGERRARETYPNNVVVWQSEGTEREVSLAQLVEQLTLNQWVESSSLSGDTKDTFGCLFFVCLSERREEPSGVKECLGWHSERSARVVPTTRISASIERIDIQTDVFFLCFYLYYLHMLKIFRTFAAAKVFKLKIITYETHSETIDSNGITD